MIKRDRMTCFIEEGFGEESFAFLGNKSSAACHPFETTIVVRQLQQTLLLPAKPHFEWCFNGFSTCGE